jgi:hypothetical protein
MTWRRSLTFHMLHATCGFALPLLLLGTTHFWQESGPVLAGGAKLPFLFCLATATTLLLRKGSLNLKFHPLIASCYAIGFIFVTHWLCRDYSFLQGTSIRGEIILATSLIYLTSRSVLDRLGKIFPLVALLGLAYILILHTGAATIVSDDHSTFLFRMVLLKSEFPKIPFYLPLWNLGWDARDFFATGALNFFLLFWPAFYIWDPESVHTTLITALLFLVGPTMMFFATRLQGYRSYTPGFAALLSATSSLTWYRWALKYGTLGFITSACLMPPVFAFALHLLADKKKLSVKGMLFLTMCTSLMLLWSPSGLVFVPIFFASLANLRRLLQQKTFCILLVGLLALNLPWVVMFWNVSKVGNFIAQEHTTIKKPLAIKRDLTDPRNAQRPTGIKAGLEILRSTANSANPLLLIGSTLGILLLRRKHRTHYFVTFGWLVGLASFGVLAKPQLELDRMFQMLLQLGCVPSALMISQALRFIKLSQGSLKRLAPSLILGFFSVTPLPVSQILLNRSLVQYSVADDSWDKMRDVLHRFAQSGRILFSGCVVHQFEDAHIAPLAVQTGIPLVASSPVHNLWWYTDIVPEEVRKKGPQAIEEYMDLLNVSAVFAHEKKWRDYFRKSSHYSRITEIENFVLYQRHRKESSYFIRGAGKILKQDLSSVRLTLETSDAILSFRYFPFLQASGCNIKPYRIIDELPFVHLSDCPIGQDIVLDSVSPLGRLRKVLNP